MVQSDIGNRGLKIFAVTYGGGVNDQLVFRIVSHMKRLNFENVDPINLPSTSTPNFEDIETADINNKLITYTPLVVKT